MKILLTLILSAGCFAAQAQDSLKLKNKTTLTLCGGLNINQFYRVEDLTTYNGPVWLTALPKPGVGWELMLYHRTRLNRTITAGFGLGVIKRPVSYKYFAGAGYSVKVLPSLDTVYEHFDYKGTMNYSGLGMQAAFRLEAALVSKPTHRVYAYTGISPVILSLTKTTNKYHLVIKQKEIHTDTLVSRAEVDAKDTERNWDNLNLPLGVGLVLRADKPHPVHMEMGGLIGLDTITHGALFFRRHSLALSVGIELN